MEFEKKQNPSVAPILFLAIILGFVGGALGGLLTSSVNRGHRLEGRLAATEQSRRQTPATPRQVTLGTLPDSFADVAESVIPCVVNINTLNDTGVELDEEFRRRFMIPIPVPRERQGIGSGIIVRDNGIILTNEHVVKDAKQIRVTLSDGSKYEGKLLGTDRELDAAVIKIEAEALPFARLGDATSIRPGDWALAVGSPMGLSSSVALGVISGLDRPIHISDRAYDNLIQTDAAISPGSSGGPLLNASGEVIGVNTAIQIDSAPAIGAAATRIGFAVPINPIKDVLELLIKGEKVVRPWVGIFMQEITEEDVSRWDLPEKEGVIVRSVVDGSPAEKAGLFQGDIILKVDGLRVRNAVEIKQRVRAHKVGEKVVFEIKREWADGSWRDKTIEVKTEPMPEEPLVMPVPEIK